MSTANPARFRQGIVTIPSRWRRLMAVVPGVLLWATVGSIAAEGDRASQESFEERFDKALGQLRGYDFGASPSPGAAITDLVAATYNQPEQRRRLAAALVEVLRSGAPRGAKSLACRELATIGTAESVPALAGLLADENLSHIARFALERIPGPAADEALRQALGKVHGKFRIGVVNSLGNRKCQSAVGDLSRLLADADPAVAAAAASALGKIGPAAVAALESAPAGGSMIVKRAVIEARLRSAEALLADGKHGDAAAIYDRLRRGDVPAACRAAATRGAILARQAEGSAILVELLRGDDGRLFGLGLSLVRDERGLPLSAAAANTLETLTGPRRCLLVEALADRGDQAAMPAVLRLANQGETTVRAAAILALGRLGNAELAKPLLRWASDEDPAIAGAGMSALARLPDKGVDQALLAAVERGDGKTRAVASEILGQRRVAGATRVLLKAACDGDETVRRAAIKALGGTAGPQDVAGLAGLVLHAKSPGDLTAAEATLAGACARMPDRDVIVGQLTAALDGASSTARAALFRALGQIGGARALEAVKSAVADADPSARDAALRVLADWQEVAAAPELLALAKAAEGPKQKILALRGYLRLVGHRDLGPEKKLEMCRQAMPLADRAEEKRLVLGALRGVPTAEALALVVPCLDDPALKNEAAAAAVAIGERLSGNAAVLEAMKKVPAATENPDVRARAAEVLKRAGKK